MRAFSRDHFSRLKRSRITEHPWAISLTALALVTVITPGCGGNPSNDPQNPAADAQAPPVAGQPNPAPAANAGQAKAGGRKGFKIAFNKKGKDQKEAANQEEAAKTPEVQSSKDLSKWGLADLKAALNRKDIRFFAGVFLFGMSKPRDMSRATDLNVLLREVAKLKDDPKIDLPLPPMAAAVPGQPGVVNPAGFQLPPNGAAAGGFQLGAGRRRKKDKG